jgi:CDP-6-deoxy-D-xylo-4-hexulose-3-dehydrase
MGLKHIMTTTSGSSANLLAFTALTAKELKERRILPGDEVITVAA